jgi:predicted glycosyltransferase involved in capsule biosynthesis
MTMPSHLIIPTHTTRHLETVLKNASLLTPAPTTVSVTCDVNHSEIQHLVETCAKRFGFEIHYTAREHSGIMRLSQTRNNGVRTLLNHGHESGLLIFIDGDIVLQQQAIRQHLALAKKADVIACERYNLTEQETLGYTSRIMKGENCSPHQSPDELSRLQHLDKNRRKHLFLRKFGLTKPGKPKIIGCHFSVNLDKYIEVNGFDEAYEGYGCEDDDFARRLHRMGCRYNTAAVDIPAFHLYHPSQAGKAWKDNPGSRRYKENSWKPRCEYGLDTPLPQAEPVSMLFKP